MFSRPWLLLLLALPVLHLYWVWTRRSGRVAMPFDSDGSRRLGSGGFMRAVLGVGLARGVAAIDLRVMRDIVFSWLLTLPAAGLMSGLLYLMFKSVLGA